jgi:hypothetical protein
MPRGGKRPGAGRKPGGENRKSREIADRLSATGVLPLEVMLAAMRDHYEAKRFDKAAAVARDAAPYMHPRLASITHKGDDAAPPIRFSLEAAVAELQKAERDRDPERVGSNGTAH